MIRRSFVVSFNKRPKNLSKKSSQTLGAEYLTEQHCWRKGVLLPKSCVASSSSLHFTGPMPQQKWHRKISFETGKPQPFSHIPQTSKVNHTCIAHLRSIHKRHRKSPQEGKFQWICLQKSDFSQLSKHLEVLSFGKLEPTLEGRNDTGHVQDPQGSHGWPRQKGNPMDPWSPKSNLNPTCFYHVFVSVNFDLSFHCLQKIHH